MGIGLDEKNTAIVVRGDMFQVIGESYVAMYDGTRWSAEKDTIYQLPKGSREYYFLRAGDEYDLKKRKIIEYKDLAFINLSENNLSKYTGKYLHSTDSSVVELFIENDSLKATQSWNNDTYPILPVTPTKFYIEGISYYYKFEFNEDKEIVNFVVPKNSKTIWKKVENE